MSDLNDRFGMPDSAFKAAIAAHGESSAIRVGMYVPTREEVATLSPDELSYMMIEWMWESPSELIPSRAQIAEVQSVLKARTDAEKFSNLIESCQNFIDA